jgi:hypothetical protein
MTVGRERLDDWPLLGVVGLVALTAQARAPVVVPVVDTSKRRRCARPPKTLHRQAQVRVPPAAERNTPLET